MTSRKREPKSCASVGFSSGGNLVGRLIGSARKWENNSAWASGLRQSALAVTLATAVGTYSVPRAPKGGGGWGSGVNLSFTHSSNPLFVTHVNAYI